MGDFSALLTKRLNKNEKNSKMSEMAKQSAAGNLSSFTGLFRVAELNENEKGFLEAILNEYSTAQSHFAVDLQTLSSITSEVKAINSQAAVLHGERIKKAQEIFKNYKEGAFSAWLTAAYGNRQTPYNFLQYYEFYIAMPKELHSQIESMPRQAIYTLASRQGPWEEKIKIIEQYAGETKAELLTLIREAFPLTEADGRRENIGESTIKTLVRLLSKMKSSKVHLYKSQQTDILDLLDEIYEIVERCKTK